MCFFIFYHEMSNNKTFPVHLNIFIPFLDLSQKDKCGLFALQHQEKKTRFLFFSISTFCEDLCSLVFFVAVMLCFLFVHVKVLLSAFLFPLSHSHTRFQVQSSTRVSLLVNYPSLCLSLWFSVVLRHIICFINFEKIFFFIRFITVSL